MPTAKITKRTVDSIKPGDRQFVIWDTETKGFGLLILPSGTRSYIFQYRVAGSAGKLKRATIGRHGSPWTPDKARERAIELAEQARRGIDPIQRQKAAHRQREWEQAQEKELAFTAYAERFIEHVAANLRDRTRESYQQMLAIHVSPVLKDKPLPAITKSDVARVLDKIPVDSPSVRRLAYAVLHRLFTWARERGDIVSIPLAGMKAPKAAPSRERVLSDDELALALQAAALMDAPFGPFFTMLFATGQRRDEVAGISWNEIDCNAATWTLPSERTKNADANIVSLNRLALAALDQMATYADGDGKDAWPQRGLIFTTNGKTPISGFSRAKKRLDSQMLVLAEKQAIEAGQSTDNCELDAWRIHDARRTLATGLQRLGIRFEVTEAVLNHRSGRSQSGVAAVYQRHGWGPEKRAALDAWGEHCEALLSGNSDKSNVIPMVAPVA